MNFYTSIAPYYDRIFPYDETLSRFIISILDSGKKKVSRSGFLDVGCATGTVLSALSGQFDRLAGIDLDAVLVALAAGKLGAEGKKADLRVADMMTIAAQFTGERFSLITCLGNTLPHLTGKGQLGAFFRTVRESLEDGGVFIFQIINYDRILDGHIRGLPVIERPGLIFTRSYPEQRTDGLLDFDTILRDTGTNVEIKNSVVLNPVRKDRVEELLRTAGFGTSVFYGNFAGDGYRSDSFLEIGVCYK